MLRHISRRQFVVAVAALAALPLAAQVSRAHEAPCPVCNMDLAQDTPEQDNETVLKTGRKRIEYRCVWCALTDANASYKGDLTVLAPSEKKGSPVTISRKNGQWTASPQSAVFAAQKANHKVCHITYRAFTDKAGFEAWVKKYKDNFAADAKPLTLAEMVALAK